MATKTAFRTSVLSLCSAARERRRASSVAAPPARTSLPPALAGDATSRSSASLPDPTGRPAHAEPTIHQRPRSSACRSSCHPACAQTGGPADGQCRARSYSLFGSSVRSTTSLPSAGLVY
eukprot:scaffold14375_cov133-Isochrysis_galbana.AAC.2